MATGTSPARARTTRTSRCTASPSFPSRRTMGIRPRPPSRRAARPQSWISKGRRSTGVPESHHPPLDDAWVVPDVEELVPPVEEVVPELVPWVPSVVVVVVALPPPPPVSLPQAASAATARSERIVIKRKVEVCMGTAYTGSSTTVRNAHLRVWCDSRRMGNSASVARRVIPCRRTVPRSRHRMTRGRRVVPHGLHRVIQCRLTVPRSWHRVIGGPRVVPHGRHRVIGG
jgi:hypothetical protein